MKCVQVGGLLFGQRVDPNAVCLQLDFRDGAVDLATFDRLLDAQLAAGIDALVICGTTGESATLTPAEQGLLFNFRLLTPDEQKTVVDFVYGVKQQHHPF